MFFDFLLATPALPKKRVTPHALRRSCATELIRNGANPGHVKDILGHEELQSLQAFVRLAAVDLKDAQAKYRPRETGDAPAPVG